MQDAQDDVDHVVARGHPSVLLLSLPWIDLDTPNLGLGILASVLDEAGIPCRVRHLNLEFLTFLTSSSYYSISHIHSFNDFMFTGVLEDTVSPLQLRWLRIKVAEFVRTSEVNIEQYGGVDGLIEHILTIRSDVIPKWLSDTADDIAEDASSLVGFSCMFDQTIASIALAKLVKIRAPEKLLVLGGYAVREPTAETLMKSFEWLDAICIQEGDSVIVQLALLSAGLRAFHEVNGIRYRDEFGDLKQTSKSEQINIEDVPTPNFDCYFSDLETLSKDHSVNVQLGRLPIENSRGCWWGQKKHCTFCGIKKSDLSYRFRSAAKTLAEMRFLADKYKCNTFRFSDYILPLQYYKDLLPQIIDIGAPFCLDAEMKANVREHEFSLIAQAGFRSMQPGIESFSSATLRQMNKGVSSVQNIYLLRLGKEFGVMMLYNILYGFPEDNLVDYERVEKSIPLLRHFEPPMTYVPVQITRDSPLHTHPEHFGIQCAPYEASYDLIFSQGFIEKTGFNLKEFCYYFERPFENRPALQRAYSRIGKQINNWRLAKRSRRPSLTYRLADGRIQVCDTREADKKCYALSELETLLYLGFGKPASRQKVFNELSSTEHMHAIQHSFNKLRDYGLVFEDESLVVGLMVEVGIGSAGNGTLT